MSWLLNGMYLFAVALLSPWLAWRGVRTGRYRRDLGAKLLGRVAFTTAGRKPVAWFHGVSVGEIHLLMTVVAAFQKRHPGWRCVVSSTTDTGLAAARAKFTEVVPWPFDFSWAVAAALDTVRPTLVVLAEAEMWPNFLRAANARHIPVAVINARLSPRSFGRYRRVAGLARRLLFDRVQCIAVQSRDYAERFAALGVPPVKHRITGSVKYDGATANREVGMPLRQLLAVKKSHLILVAGSTHPPEEAILLDAFRTLSGRFPQLRLLLVPRHPDRFDDVAALLARSGMEFQRRSRMTANLDELPAIVLLDSIGELAAAWSLADVGYVGGTLDGVRGGQSMIEPAGFGVPTVFGPHVWNFRDAAKRLVEAGGAIMVNDAAAVTTALGDLLADAERRGAMGQAAARLVKEQQGATTRTLDVLEELLPLRERVAA